MTKKCELTGKRPLKGHKVSHANNKVKRRFLPGIKKVNFTITARQTANTISIIAKLIYIICINLE